MHFLMAIMYTSLYDEVSFSVSFRLSDKSEHIVVLELQKQYRPVESCDDTSSR